MITGLGAPFLSMGFPCVNHQLVFNDDFLSRSDVLFHDNFLVNRQSVFNDDFSFKSDRLFHDYYLVSSDSVFEDDYRIKSNFIFYKDSMSQP